MVDLIFDRTSADLEYAKRLHAKFTNGTITEAEKAEWNLGLRGYYNHTDLNRVETAVKILGSVLVSHGYFVPVITKTDWMMGDTPTISQLQQISNNITKLCNGFYVYFTTPDVPIINFMNIQKANDIEKILFDMDRIIKVMGKSLLYSNTFYANDDIVTSILGVNYE